MRPSASAGAKRGMGCRRGVSGHPDTRKPGLPRLTVRTRAADPAPRAAPVTLLYEKDQVAPMACRPQPRMQLIPWTPPGTLPSASAGLEVWARAAWCDRRRARLPGGGWRWGAGGRRGPDRDQGGRDSAVEPPPARHVVGHVGERDRCPGAGDADGADGHPHARLLLGEDVLDPGTCRRLRGVGAAGALGHRSPPAASCDGCG